MFWRGSVKALQLKVVDILYFESCPGWQGAAARVREVLDECGLEADVRLVPIETEEAAQAHRFVGSPTIRVDGRDVERVANAPEAFGLQCRLYTGSDRLDGIPPKELIRDALVGVTHDQRG
jgi:hypothetical protein